MWEFIAGTVFGTLSSFSLLFFGYKFGWNARNQAGLGNGEPYIETPMGPDVDDPIGYNPFEPQEKPEED